MIPYRWNGSTRKTAYPKTTKPIYIWLLSPPAGLVSNYTACWNHSTRRVFYYDTDSVIYSSKPGQYDPPLGDYLGELTNELGVGEHIVEFVSGGPKNYAYKTNKNEETCKVRGFTLNFANSKLINFETVKHLVTDPKSRQTITVTNSKKICRDKRKRKLYNREEDKNYRMVYTKRRRLDNYEHDTLRLLIRRLDTSRRGKHGLVGSLESDSFRATIKHLRGRSYRSRENSLGRATTEESRWNVRQRSAEENTVLLRIVSASFRRSGTRYSTFYATSRTSKWS